MSRCHDLRANFDGGGWKPRESIGSWVQWNHYETFSGAVALSEVHGVLWNRGVILVQIEPPLSCKARLTSCKVAFPSNAAFTLSITAMAISKTCRNSQTRRNNDGKDAAETCMSWLLRVGSNHVWYCMFMFCHSAIICNWRSEHSHSFYYSIREADKSTKHQIPLPTRSTYFYVLYKTRAKQRDTKHATSLALTTENPWRDLKELSHYHGTFRPRLTPLILHQFSDGILVTVLASPQKNKSLQQLRAAPIWCWTHLDTRKPSLQVDKTGLRNV